MSQPTPEQLAKYDQVKADVDLHIDAIIIAYHHAWHTRPDVAPELLVSAITQHLAEQYTYDSTRTMLAVATERLAQLTPRREEPPT